MKLQDAYVAEKGTFAGTWTNIGYNMPASTNFDYSGALAADVALEGLTKTKGWSAKNNAKLNDCNKESEWKISIAEASNDDASKGSPIAYFAETPDNAEGSTNGNCASLTPNFTNLSSGAAKKTE